MSEVFHMAWAAWQTSYVVTPKHFHIALCIRHKRCKKQLHLSMYTGYFAILIFHVAWDLKNDSKSHIYWNILESVESTKEAIGSDCSFGKVTFRSLLVLRDILSMGTVDHHLFFSAVPYFEEIYSMLWSILWFLDASSSSTWHGRFVDGYSFPYVSQSLGGYINPDFVLG